MPKVNPNRVLLTDPVGGGVAVGCNGRAVGRGVEVGAGREVGAGVGAQRAQSWVDPGDSAIRLKVITANAPVPENPAALLPVNNNLPSPRS